MACGRKRLAEAWPVERDGIMLYWAAVLVVRRWRSGGRFLVNDFPILTT